METLYFLIPIALVIVTVALKILFWAINNGQFDDLETEGHRILFDEDKSPEINHEKNTSKDEHSLNKSNPS